VSPAAAQPQSSAGKRAWAPVRGIRSSEQVVEQIRDAFFAGMQPGDWVGTEGELAERFGVSRLTLRDAVRTLEAMGILDVKVGSGGGVRVAQGDPSRFSDALAVQAHLLGVEWSEITEAMRLIEPSAARLAAERATKADVDKLEASLEAQAAAKTDPEAFNAATAAFHLIIAEATDNRPLYAALRALRMNQERLLVPKAAPRVAAKVLASHGALVEAIRRRDGAEAERVMAAHLDVMAAEPPR
jgi:GntR family transcriptional regulator, transcriptional repressor for pyruvate dehydrogenase complex